MRPLYLVRHGESGWNRAQLIQGQSPDAPGLTPAGRAHAAAVAGQLAGSGAVLVLSSDLRRAAETAAPIAARLGAPVRLEPRLRERALGAAEGRPSAQTGPDELGFSRETVTDPDAAPAGGESLRQLYVRITSLLVHLLDGSWATGGPGTPGEGPVVLVTHGGPVRIARAWLDGLGPDEMTWPPVRNGSLLEVPSILGSRRGFL
jgi:2,3-bisphosphoglycerate-dependent phosphoglycerate mutase